MKKSLTALIALCGLLVFSGSVWSFTITGGIDVGGLDGFLAGAGSKNSGDKTETQWVKDALDGLELDSNVELTEKTNTPSDRAWVQTNDPNVYAFKLIDDTIDYFLIKTGNLKLSPTNFDTFLFRNNSNMSYAVVGLLNSVPGTSLVNIGKFSHIDEFNGTAAVPEPATLLLLGFGLTGLYGIKRMRRGRK